MGRDIVYWRAVASAHAYFVPWGDGLKLVWGMEGIFVRVKEVNLQVTSFIASYLASCIQESFEGLGCCDKGVSEVVNFI
jgi:hypothetical protein